MRVLQVEDDAATASAVEAMLASGGHACDTVARGEEAVERAQADSYDLILLDITLPGIDGFEVLRRLQAAQVDLPVLIQSGLIGSEQKVEGLSLGVDDFLVKPFSKEELSERIACLLKRQVETQRNAARQEDASDRRAEPRSNDEGRRRAKRTRTLRSGQIIYNYASCVIDCVIQDLSETGARLEAADIFDCPETVTLQVLNGSRYRCHVRWQTGKKLGVEFDTN